MKKFTALLGILTITTLTFAQTPHFLPHILIEGNPGNEYTKCKYYFVENQDKDTIKLQAKIRWRGNTAKTFNKKSYAIKIIDDKGKGKDVSFLGMRKDNNWILDAMAIDKARMRNRVSFDLWNDFSNKSYIFNYDKKAINGTRGNFVEVYLNGEYNGIYCLTEKIDRKQLRLNKYNKDGVHGILYKADGFLYTGFWEVDQYDNSKMTWGGWEMKYPELDKGESIDWKPLYDATSFILNSTDKEFDEKVSNVFDLPVWADYYLFANVIMAFDNSAKNVFTYIYDNKTSQKLGFAPWDLDATWGRNHIGKLLSAQKKVPFHKLYSRLLKSEKINFMENIAHRYLELRKTILSENSLKERFHNYFQLFKETGAAQRETEKWNGVNGIEIDFDKEESYINKWIEERLTYLDEKVKAFSTKINTFEEEKDISNHSNIYTLEGIKVNEKDLKPGIYIKNKKKILIK